MINNLYIKATPTVAAVTWGSITGTLSAQTDLQSALDAKQVTLVSGTNIKTVNSNSLLGSGDLSVGTVTSVGVTAGTGISVSGSPITSSGTITVTNSAPDQVVAIAAGTGIGVTGTYPNFTVTNSAPSSGGTVTSVAALTLGTTGADLSSTVANGTTTPVITLNVPTASAANRGALSSTDWTTFNNKQNALGFTAVPTTRTISTTAPLSGGGDLSADRTLSMPAATTLVDGYISATDWTTFNGKQAALVSGTNIKTINGNSVLGSGNLVVSASPSGIAGAVQFSNGSAFSSDAANLFFDDTNNRLGVGTNVPTSTIHSKGSGATNATTALLVQNSAGTNSLQCTDDLSVFSNGKGAVATNTIFGKGAFQGTSPSGTDNTAVGYQALLKNTSGSFNVAFGADTLSKNTTGSRNSGFGGNALLNNTTGTDNTALGILALYGNTTGIENIGVGNNAYFNNSTGGGNTVIGYNGLSGVSVGNNNTSVGRSTTASGNVSGCIILGSGAAATASNQFVVGSATVNAGTVVAEINTSANVWNVRINGVARKILLA